jgi:large subunit ribosomal protein L32
MAVPRNRMSNARKNSKRAHHAKKPKSMSKCSNCDSPKLPHVLCQACGSYNNRMVVSKEAAQ